MESEESDVGDSTQSHPVELTTNSTSESRHELPPHYNNLLLDHPASLMHHRNSQVNQNLNSFTYVITIGSTRTKLKKC